MAIMEVVHRQVKCGFEKLMIHNGLTHYTFTHLRLSTLAFSSSEKSVKCDTIDAYEGGSRDDVGIISLSLDLSGLPTDRFLKLRTLQLDLTGERRAK